MKTKNEVNNYSRFMKWLAVGDHIEIIGSVNIASNGVEQEWMSSSQRQGAWYAYKVTGRSAWVRKVDGSDQRYDIEWFDAKGWKYEQVSANEVIATHSVDFGVGTPYVSTFRTTYRITKQANN